MNRNRSVSVRVNRETKAELQLVCRKFKITESEFCRSAIQGYLRTAYGISVPSGLERPAPKTKKGQKHVT